jgi:hypothetical protein
VLAIEHLAGVGGVAVNAQVLDGGALLGVGETGRGALDEELSLEEWRLLHDDASWCRGKRDDFEAYCLSFECVCRLSHGRPG